MLTIGLTGTIASGKEAVASLLGEAGYAYFSLSDRVREEATRQGLQTPSRADLQRIGNEIRHSEGPAAWAKRTLEKIESARVGKAVVDGFRNPHEVAYFRQCAQFYLVAVDAPSAVRFKRFLERQRPGDPRTLAEFLEVDARDRGVGEPEEGQQVGACLQLAQFTLWNDGTLEELRGKLGAVLAQIQPQSR